MADNDTDQWATGYTEINISMNVKHTRSTSTMPYQLMFLRAPRFNNENWLDRNARKTAKVLYEDGEEQEDIDLPDSGVSRGTVPTYLANQNNASIAAGIGSFQTNKQGKQKEKTLPPNLPTQPTSTPQFQLPTSTPQSQLQADKQLARDMEQALLQDVEMEDREQAEQAKQAEQEEQLEQDKENEADGEDSDSDHSGEQEEESAGPSGDHPKLVRARERAALTRRQNKRGYNNRHNVAPLEKYHVGYIVRLKLYGKKRASQSAPASVFARILQKDKKKGLYTLQTNHGVISKTFRYRDLLPVPYENAKHTFIDDKPEKISLKQVAIRESRAQLVRISCSCKKWPCGKKCNCIKANVKCSIHCHGKNPECGNVAQGDSFNEWTTVPRPSTVQTRSISAGEKS